MLRSGVIFTFVIHGTVVISLEKLHLNAHVKIVY